MISAAWKASNKHCFSFKKAACSFSIFSQVLNNHTTFTVKKLKKNKNKNEYNWILTNKWSDQKTQSDYETISKMLCELSTKQLNRTVTCSTVCI